MRKRFFSILCILGFCTSALQAQAMQTSTQEEQKIKLTGGPVLEVNMSNFIHSGIVNGQSKMKLGVTTGGFLNLGISKTFSVQGELLLHYKTSDFKWNNQVGKYQYGGLEIPVYAMCHFTFPKDNRIQLGIGPYTDFGLKGSFNEGGNKVNVYEKDKETGQPIMKDSNTGFGIKVGYELASGFQVNAIYKVSITNIIDSNSSKIKMYPQTLNIGVAYRFGK